MQKKISILIPTYNRNEILCRNLILLLPQITAEVEVVVLDNNSIIPVKETMQHLLPDYYAEKIKVVQNRFNVGGNQNILRCFEFCDGQYMWLLGDDDSPDPNAVEHILMEISKNPDAVVYNMYSDAPSHGFRQSSKVVYGSLGYLCAAEFLGELLFISTLVFRVEACVQFLSRANNLQSTCAPQLILILSALNLDKKAVISCKRVVGCGASDTPPDMLPSTIPTAIGINGLLQHYWNDNEYYIIRRLLVDSRRKWMTAYGLINQLVDQMEAAQSGLDISVVLRQYKIIKNGLFSIGWVFSFDWWLFRMGIVAVYFPSFGIWLRNRLWKYIKGSSATRHSRKGFDRW